MHILRNTLCVGRGAQSRDQEHCQVVCNSPFTPIFPQFRLVFTGIKLVGYETQTESLP